MEPPQPKTREMLTVTAMKRHAGKLSAGGNLRKALMVYVRNKLSRCIHVIEDETGACLDSIPSVHPTRVKSLRSAVPTVSSWSLQTRSRLFKPA